MIFQTRSKYLRSINHGDTLLVPDTFWHVVHHFEALEGKAFLNPSLKPLTLGVAEQDILFRLDKSGAILKSESKHYTLAQAKEFVFDRPFLIYMKKRGSPNPYFAMWVDNAELLRTWQAAPEGAKGGAPSHGTAVIP